MDAIEENYKTVEKKNREVLLQWLKGKGKNPVTWNTLIVVLREVKLHYLADYIGSRVTPAACNTLVLPFVNDYSKEDIDQLKMRYSGRSVVVIDHIKYMQAKLPFLDLVLKENDSNFMTLEDVLESIQTHKQLLIIGQPGSGKTTLMKYLAKQWADGKALEFCQILFLISLEFYRDAYYSLRDLLSVQYKEWDKYVDGIVQGNGKGSCFLLDAFDEKLNKRDFVYQLMTNNELYDSVRIITSRPDDDLPADVKKYAVEIVGFKFDKLDSYLHELSDNNTAKQIRKEFWKDRQVNEMCQLPQHMAMIIVIAQSKQRSSIKTKTQIYTAFMNATIDHYKFDHPNWDIHALRQCVLHKLDDKLCKAVQSHWARKHSSAIPNDKSTHSTHFDIN